MYEAFEHLLQIKNLTAYQVHKATGVSQTALSNWKNGKSVPSAKTLQKIADYLGVTVDYLINGEGYYINPETAKTAQKIFENKDLQLLFDAASDAAPEDLQAVHAMLLALKRKEKRND